MGSAIRKVPLGNTEFEITAIGYGAMPLSLEGRPDEATAIAVIRAYVEGGGNFIDTANVYCRNLREVGHNERLIAKALASFAAGKDVLVATKCGLTKEGGGWDCDGRPKFLRQSCEESLKALGVEQIFLYQLHAVDPNVPLADSMGELARLKAEGKVRYVGVSNFNAEELHAALRIVPVVSLQNKAHIFRKRDFRNGLVKECATLGVTFIPHSPVGGHGMHSKLSSALVLKDITARLGVSPHQVSLAWLLHKGPHIVPIPGASRIASVTSSLAAADIKLSAADVTALDRLPDW
jgi:aryl-alcohol dehydrogenase-like predicted oxidoreductase